jgi:hypothetical protein
MTGEPLPSRILIPVANPLTAEELIRIAQDSVGFHSCNHRRQGRLDVPQKLRQPHLLQAGQKVVLETQSNVRVFGRIRDHFFQRHRFHRTLTGVFSNQVGDRDHSIIQELQGQIIQLVTGLPGVNERAGQHGIGNNSS